jgi:phage baseplate assembly protein W
MNWMAHPYRADLGRTARSDDAAHVRDMLEQVLFTAPGERVNRPDFGCGLNQLLFLGNSPDLALSVDMTVRGAVQRWLSEVMTLEALTVRSEDATLIIDLVYRLKATGESQQISLTRPVS